MDFVERRKECRFVCDCLCSRCETPVMSFVKGKSSKNVSATWHEKSCCSLNISLSILSHVRDTTTQFSERFSHGRFKGEGGRFFSRAWDFTRMESIFFKVMGF